MGIKIRISIRITKEKNDDKINFPTFQEATAPSPSSCACYICGRQSMDECTATSGKTFIMTHELTIVSKKISTTA